MAFLLQNSEFTSHKSVFVFVFSPRMEYKIANLFLAIASLLYVSQFRLFFSELRFLSHNPCNSEEKCPNDKE